MGSTMIETLQLVKDYPIGGQRIRALDQVSVRIESGEFVAIMGPSGSGKSTLMNLLGCLTEPSAGHYILDGQEMAGLDRRTRAAVRNAKIGFVFQSFHLLARLSALENVALPLVYSGLPGRQRLTRARQALEAVGLGERRQHYPLQLSGGQQQRVAIARALVADPMLILADEPTGALDSRTGAGIMALFQQLHQRGKTVVLVTHDPSIAAHARRQLHFHDGRLIEDRTENVRPLSGGRRP